MTDDDIDDANVIDDDTINIDDDANDMDDDDHDDDVDYEYVIVPLLPILPLRLSFPHL